MSLLRGLRILVVEDQRTVRMLLTRVLEHAGADVTAVGSTSEALAAFEIAEPDVLVSDIRLPGDDGYALMRKLRTRLDERGLHLPAIAISASIGEDEVPRLHEVGFQMFIRKPFHAAEIRDAVASVSGRG